MGKQAGQRWHRERLPCCWPRMGTEASPCSASFLEKQQCLLEKLGSSWPCGAPRPQTRRATNYLEPGQHSLQHGPEVSAHTCLGFQETPPVLLVGMGPSCDGNLPDQMPLVLCLSSSFLSCGAAWCEDWQWPGT